MEYRDYNRRTVLEGQRCYHYKKSNSQYTLNKSDVFSPVYYKQFEPSPDQKESDLELKEKIIAAIKKQTDIDLNGIILHVLKGEVSLAGWLSSREDKIKIKNIMKQFVEASHYHDYLHTGL